MNQVAELKSSGLKATLPRIKILEVFQRATQRHMTAEDVFKVLLTEGADVGLATVYRVLMQFEQAGLLTRSNFESGKAVFELNEGQHHDHLVCLTCGRCHFTVLGLGPTIADVLRDGAVQQRGVLGDDTD